MKIEIIQGLLMLIILMIGFAAGTMIENDADRTPVQVTNTTCDIDYSQMGSSIEASLQAIVDDFEPVLVETTYVIESSVYDAFPLRKHRKCGNRAETYRVHGQSMHPLISDGVVMAEPVKWADVEVGDVVEIVADGKNIFHALVYKNDEEARSRGYNNEHMDPWVVLPEMVTKRYCVK